MCDVGQKTMVVCDDIVGMNLRPEARHHPATEGQELQTGWLAARYVSFLITPGKDVIERVRIVDPKGSGPDCIMHEGWLLSRRNDK